MWRESSIRRLRGLGIDNFLRNPRNLRTTYSSPRSSIHFLRNPRNLRTTYSTIRN